MHLYGDFHTGSLSKADVTQWQIRLKSTLDHKVNLSLEKNTPCCCWKEGIHESSTGPERPTPSLF